MQICINEKCKHYDKEIVDNCASETLCDISKCDNYLKGNHGDGAKLLCSEGLVLQVLWKNEDELPEMTKEVYDSIYDGSKVDIVRLFPYVILEGKECYLRMKN